MSALFGRVKTMARRKSKTVQDTPPKPKPKRIRKLHLLTNYGGTLTNERRIAEGIYAEKDPALFGLASRLVADGEAVWVYEEG